MAKEAEAAACAAKFEALLLIAVSLPSVPSTGCSSGIGGAAAAIRRCVPNAGGDTIVEGARRTAGAELVIAGGTMAVAAVAISARRAAVDAPAVSTKR